MTTIIRSFAPICDRNARALVLGSMPGATSLRAGQYYAHPANTFWRIVGEITGTAPDAPYSQRVRALRRAHIALWDVLAACRRSGSLDADIDKSSIVANDFPELFARCPRLSHVFFNGALAQTAFMRHVRPLLEDQALIYLRLPSTSPANAACSFAQKREAWSALARVVHAAPDPNTHPAGKRAANARQ